MPKYAVATIDEIPPSGRKVVEIAGRSIGIFNLDGEYFALRNRCPHEGGPLCSGVICGLVSSDGPGDYQYTRPGQILRCPWHGWEFDIRTGQSWVDPRNVRVRSYDVSVEPAPSSGEWVQGPYVAETYDVSVEQHLVMVEVPS